MTVQQQFESALSHHRAGRLAEAEALYRQVLQRQPNHIEACNNLGSVFRVTGRLDEAVAAWRRVVAMNPGVAEVHANLGIALKDQGRVEEAVTACRRAVELKPNLAGAHNNLGTVLRAERKLDEAIAAFRRSILLDAGFAEAHNNLGNALKDKGEFDAAVGAYQQAIALNPKFPEAHNNLGNALKDMGRVDDAIACYRLAIGLRPDYAEAFSNLGNALKDKGDVEGAAVAYGRAVALNPNLSEAHSNLGAVLKDAGRLDDAIAACRRALAINPKLAEAHCNLGAALSLAGQIDEAVVDYRRAIALRLDYAGAHSNLGTALKDKGDVDGAIAAYRKAIALDPGNAALDSNLVYTMYFHPGYDARAIADEHRRWNRQHAETIGGLNRAFSNARTADRRLRIGYVGADFREHCQSNFIIPLLSHHDRTAHEIFCYAHVLQPDATTGRIQSLCDGWRSIVGMNDEEAAEQMRADKIDILVDLTMHMANGRPLMFARKPAPVQAAWLAYPGTTGLSAMDYRLTDPYLDPPGSHDDFYSEKSVRLPETFWCYDSLAEDIAVNAPPAQSNGNVTFGCLNNFCKVNEQVVRLWARVLKAVDRSRLIILCPEGDHRQNLLGEFQREGIDPDRVELAGRRPRLEYFKLYHRIDVGLDTFPYNGHTTSLDSYWMGVPVITLVGKTVVGRAGLSQLSNLGLTELIALEPEQYVQIAADLAGDVARMTELRRTLRARMQASPLMDGPRFARNIESAYRQMWRGWCEEASR